MTARYTWRKLGGAKWEDAWTERLTQVRDRLAITALAGAKTIRLEVFELTKSQAEGLRRSFGGVIGRQKKPRLVSETASVPLRIRGMFTVVGSEVARQIEQRAQPRRPVLHIPAGMAFGTGDHATTAGCLRLLADVTGRFAGKPWEALDLGTGSGILALASRVLGAKRAEALDFDPHAVRIARENARRNAIAGIAFRCVDLRTWRPLRTWNVVAANLFSDLLVEAAERIAAAVQPGGCLIFSGILRSQESEALAGLTAAGLCIHQVVHKGKWVSGVAEKTRGTKKRIDALPKPPIAFRPTK